MGPACIVVVEDEPSILEALGDILALDGYDFVGLTDGESVEGLECRPDLFLIDIMLPGQNGIELAAQLHAGPYRDVPIVGMSASSMMLRAAEESGLFAVVLAKPFDLVTLSESIERALGSAEQR